MLSDNRLCVCHISTVHPTFDQRIFYRECWSLQRAGYTTHLIVQSDQTERVVDGIHIHSLDTIRERSHGMKVFRRVRRMWKAKNIAATMKADIYHLHDPELILLGVWLKLRLRARIVFDCHEDNIAYLRQKTYFPLFVRGPLIVLFFALELVAARYFDGIVTADQGVAALFKRRYRAKKVQVVHNFPRLDLFLETTLTNNDQDKKFDLVYHGTIPKYHLEVAFEVASELRRRGRNVRWLFFGNGPNPEWVTAELRKRNLEEVFNYIPDRVPHSEVASHVRQAKIGFIPLPDLPKFQHNIPTKLFEYMALGMPVVLSDLPPSRPFVGDGKVAFMIPPADYGAYADAIVRLLDDKELQDGMGDLGRVRVEKQYNWEREAKHLLALYDELGASLHER